MSRMVAMKGNLNNFQVLCCFLRILGTVSVGIVAHPPIPGYYCAQLSSLKNILNFENFLETTERAACEHLVSTFLTMMF